MRVNGVLFGITGVLLLVGGCGLVSGEGDSETHWLLKCRADAQCGDSAACLCGICTVACQPDNGCANGPASSRCVPAGTAQSCGDLPPASGVCLVQCQVDGDCPRSHACEAGACVRGGGSNPTPPADVDNPTGDCVAPDDGGRRGFHSPGPESVWLIDCQNPLDREYYRVFTNADGTAYTIPRVDGSPALQVPCTTTHALSPIVAKYGLCDSASNSQQVERVNHMVPADALAVTRYLHSVLVFRPTPGSGAGISQYPIETDVLDACELHPELNSAELQDACQRTEDVLDTGINIGLRYNGVAAAELAARLNELYGIGPACGDQLAAAVCTTCGPAGGCSTVEVVCTQTCSEQVDCANATGSYCDSNVCSPSGPCI